MAKIVIVEGIDRVGKTTFVNKFLEKNRDFKVFKHDSSSDFDYSMMDNDNETDKMLQLISMVNLLDGKVVFDRFHLSEFVYGMVQRNYGTMSVIKNFDFLEAKIAHFFLDDAVLVYVAPENQEDLTRASFEHGDDLADHLGLFEFFYTCSILRKFKTNFSNLDKAVATTNALLGGKQ